MKIVSIIPARGGSKGIPKKNIYPICGKPLVAWTIEQSIETKLINHTFVTTDNDEIANVSISYGAKIIKRPESISGDSASSEAALLHALEVIKIDYNIIPDLVVFLQATSPLRKHDDINRCIQKALDENCDSIFSGCRLEDFLIWDNEDGHWCSNNYDYKNRGIRQHRKPQYVENGSIYVFRPSVLTDLNNRIGGKISFFEMEFWQTWEIDNPDDIEIVEAFLNSRIKHSSRAISLNDINLIVYDFDGVMTDNTAILDEDGKESVVINRADGLAISLFKKAGILQLILSTERNKVVQKRAEKLQLDFVNNIENKMDFLLGFVEDHKISMEKVLYLGNDINDLEAMKIVGIPACPNDAYPEIKHISKIILEKDGGQGVIRDLYDFLK